MIAMHIGDLQGARAAIAQGGHAYSSSYTHCEVLVTACLCKICSPPTCRVMAQSAACDIVLQSDQFVIAVSWTCACISTRSTRP